MNGKIPNLYFSETCCTALIYSILLAVDNIANLLLRNKHENKLKS